MSFIWRRVGETFVVFTGISVVVCLLGYLFSGLGETKLFYLVGFGFIGALALNFYMQMNHLFAVRDLAVYYRVNITAYLIFAVVTYIIYALCPPSVYSWTFIFGKILKLIPRHKMGIVPASIIMHALAIAAVWLVPMRYKTMLQRILEMSDRHRRPAR